MNSNDLFKYIEEEHKKRNLKIRNVSLLLNDIPEWHLYKNENGGIEIGIPDIIEYFSTIANMSGFDEATEKVLFYNGGSNLAKFAPYINDRPVYSIQPSDNRKVEIYDIINNSDVELLDVLDGNFKVDSDNIEEIKQLKYI